LRARHGLEQRQGRETVDDIVHPIGHEAGA
jgi:hypothetical protein